MFTWQIIISLRQGHPDDGFSIGAFSFPCFVAVIELINSAQSYFWNP